MSLSELNEKTGISEERLEQMFLFLFRLRDSAVTNMFGAGSYLEGRFSIKPRQSTPVLVYWMENCETLAGKMGVTL